MKNLFPNFAKMAAVAACALTLGSCNRAEYAMLPKGSSYHGVTRVATPVPSTPSLAAPEAAVATPAAPVLAEAPVATPAAAPVAASTPAATSADEAAVAATAATLPQQLGAQKLTRVQKFAATRLVKSMSKAAIGSKVKHTQDIAKTQRISGNLRTGIILLLIGLVVGIFNNWIGGIIALIGLIFIVLWLLDSL